MERLIDANQVLLCGTLAAPPRWSHTTRGQDFFTFPLEIRRLSGTADTVRIIARRELLASCAASTTTVAPGRG